MQTETDKVETVDTCKNESKAEKTKKTKNDISLLSEAIENMSRRLVTLEKERIILTETIHKEVMSYRTLVEKTKHEYSIDEQKRMAALQETVNVTKKLKFLIPIATALVILQVYGIIF